MSGLRPHTKMYGQSARDDLGRAVTRAREAAGYPFRPAFAKAAGVGVTSLWKLESGEPVGPVVYEAVARALPGWDVSTPQSILEGGQPPPITDRPDPIDQPPMPGLRLEGDDLELAVLLGRTTSLSQQEIERVIRERQRLREPPTVEQRTGTDR